MPPIRDGQNTDPGHGGETLGDDDRHVKEASGEYYVVIVSEEALGGTLPAARAIKFGIGNNHPT